MGMVFLMAIGLAGIVLLVLFLLDLIVAFLSRTLPQMNVLLLGFQVRRRWRPSRRCRSLSLLRASCSPGWMCTALETMPRLI